MVIELALFAYPVQARLKAWFHRAPRRIFVIPMLTTALVAAILAARDAWSTVFIMLVAAYTLLPTALVFVNGPDRRGRADSLGARKCALLDLAAMLSLWLPIEFNAGKQLIPERVWGPVGVAAHSAAVMLALFLFLIFRDLKGMKYNLPRRLSDLTNPLIGFALAAPPLIALGLALGFMGPFRMPVPFRAGAFGILWFKTLLGVALPEEILFRALIQNWLMQNFGFNHKTLLAAALVFGASHLDNPPGPLPNWRYTIIASIAGFVFGGVFWKSSTILSSAGLHALINALRHTFFL